MTLSRQEPARKKGARINQKVRTRAAIVRAATELVREGSPPSMPDAAERALVSVATAYRYFPSADDLWFEASAAAVTFEPVLAEIDDAIRAAGDDPIARLEVLIERVGFWMLDDQVPFRRLAKAALDQWFHQADVGDADRTPVREGRRNRHIATVVEPLRRRLPEQDVARIAHALGIVIGTEAMIALTDGVGLDTASAKSAMLDAGRWLLSGALAELGV
jgi:AcrR family transcriptional regulator